MHLASCTLSALRSALNHLYEPGALRANPLVAMVGAVSTADAPAALRRLLMQAIDALKPADDVPAQAPAWRVYEILHYRYVQQCSQEEVADQLGLSVRHLKREQRRALEVLAQHLNEQHGLCIGHEDESAGAEGAPAAAAVERTGLEGLAPGKPLDLKETLPAVLDLVRPLAARYAVSLELAPEGKLPPTAVHGVVLRQMLLGLLNVAIRASVEGTLTLAARAGRGGVEISVVGQSSRPAAASPDDADNLAVARQLAASCGGSLTLEGGAPFTATLRLPVAQQVAVLVIDDHVDTLQLLQRYATGTPYRVFVAQNTEEAFALAADVSPRVIVLDVMMPDVDGWELLGRLKQHPLTSRVPVIACTILAQEELAYSLGVAGFLRKPVSRRDFLAALDGVLSSPAA